MMINLRTKKVLRDVWNNKSRVILVVISIAMGLFATSSVFRSREILARELNTGFMAINPASATLLTHSVDDDSLETIDKMDSVQAVQGQHIVWARIKVGAEWRSLKLVAVSNYDDIPVDKIVPVEGEWPPPEQTLLLERSSLAAAQTQIGQPVLIETPDGYLREMPIVGLVHDLTVSSGKLVDQILFGYISLETLDWFGLSRDYNEIDILVTGDIFNKDHIREVSTQAKDTLEQEGQMVLGTQILEPGKHQMDSIIQTLLLIMGILGILSLILSSLLAFNTISAILARQVPQIGMMKAIGAPKRDILAMNMATIFIFGLLALFVSIPLGMVASRILVAQLADLFNFDIKSFSVSYQTVILEILLGLMVPTVAALQPIVRGMQITVREAIANQKGGQFGANVIDKLVARLRGLPATMLYAIRNIFRQKTRLVLALVTLSMGGAVLITVLSIRASLLLTVDDIASYWQQDLSVDLQYPYRTAKINRLLSKVSDIDQIEGWNIKSGFRVRPDGQESNEQITIFGVSVPSHFIAPTLTQGRWLRPQDETAIVINLDVFAKESDIQLGDWITLKIDGRESEWQVIGFSVTQVVGFGEPKPDNPIAYANYDYFSQVIGEVGRANRIAIETQDHDASFQVVMKQRLEEHFDAAGVRVRTIETNEKTYLQLVNLTVPILALLAFMAVLFAVVGGLALTGTMSLNVLERTQEIGIMRAVGAAGNIVMQVVIIEGIFVGLVSWILASLLAYPLSWGMNIFIGITSFYKVPFTFAFAPIGILLWLIIVLILSVLASYIPARNASSLSVRKVLAYE
ncbi:MAG: ABC transporter permease [Chloroflexi bacterium]|nr:ABC transporter permease [Chloroflexota bacterium]